ncbi:MAG: YcxB family protein [Clostridia bacterium]|nr:YcxB family protein [Clostridia bacterium]
MDKNVFPIEHKYTVTVSDLRKTAYFGLVRESNKAFLAMFVILAFALVYGIAVYSGLTQANMLIFFIAGAYLIWGLIKFAGAEKRVRLNLKAEGNTIGMETKLTVSKDDMRFEIGGHKIDNRYVIKNLAAVFELAALYMVYLDGEHMFIVPKRGLDDGQKDALRGLLRARLGNRFWTRFEKKQ